MLTERLAPVTKPELTINNTWRRFSSQKYLQIVAIGGAIWMLIFCYVPLAGLVIAFKDYNIAHPIWEAPWVGLKFFKQFVQNPDFMVVLRNTLGINIIKMFVSFPLPIIFALLLNELQLPKFKKVVQTISYLPHFLSWVILGGIMLSWFSTDTGIIGEVLRGIHLTDKHVNYLADSNCYWAIAIISAVWKELGWASIIYLAAICGIDQEMYESATIDGAKRLKKTIYITIPAILPTVAILLILSVGGMLSNNFDQTMMLNNPLNNSASNNFDLLVYNTGIKFSLFSYATAAGLLKSIVSVTLVLIANGVSKKVNEDFALF